MTTTVLRSARLDARRAEVAEQARRLSVLVEATLSDELCHGCPCVACQHEDAVGLCEITWTTRNLPAFEVDDVCLACLVAYLDDSVLREAPEYVRVCIRRPAPWLVMA